jgi:hypothetical protein
VRSSNEPCRRRHSPGSMSRRSASRALSGLGSMENIEIAPRISAFRHAQHNHYKSQQRGVAGIPDPDRVSLPSVPFPPEKAIRAESRPLIEVHPRPREAPAKPRRGEQAPLSAVAAGSNAAAMTPAIRGVLVDLVAIGGERATNTGFEARRSVTSDARGDAVHRHSLRSRATQLPEFTQEVRDRNDRALGYRIRVSMRIVDG